jgi:hypothetical protein
MPRKESNSGDLLSLFNAYGITGDSDRSETELPILLQRPLYFNRWGEIDTDIYGAYHQNASYIGTMWTASIVNGDDTVYVYYSTMGVYHSDGNSDGYVGKSFGYSVRCLAR